MIPAIDDGPYYDCIGCGCSLRWDECDLDCPMCADCLAELAPLREWLTTEAVKMEREVWPAGVPHRESEARGDGEA